MPHDNTKPPTPTTRTSRAPRLALLLTLSLIAAPLLTPGAAADHTSEKRVCDPTDPNEPATLPIYCVKGGLETTDITCTGSGSSYECTFFARAFVEGQIPEACGSADTNATANNEPPAGMCVTPPEIHDREETDWKKHTFSNIGPQGLTAWFWVEVCVWVNGAPEGAV